MTWGYKKKDRSNEARGYIRDGEKMKKRLIIANGA
jgi:hypothetical protein